MVMGLFVGGLGFSILSLRLRRKIAKSVFAAIVAVFWLIVACAIPPAIISSSSYGGFFTLAGMLPLGVLVFILACVSAIELFRTSLALVAWILLISASISLAFITPFALWCFNVISSYYAALLVGTLLAGGILMIGWLMAPRWISKGGNVNAIDKPA